MPNEEHQAYLIKFGKRLEILRKSKKLTLRKLAQNCNIDHSDIAKYERGEVNISFFSILELADGLGVTHQDLMDF